jgi:hypothetical protein
MAYHFPVIFYPYLTGYYGFEIRLICFFCGLFVCGAKERGDIAREAEFVVENRRSLSFILPCSFTLQLCGGIA